jgi:hypothetical protein
MVKFNSHKNKVISIIIVFIIIMLFVIIINLQSLQWHNADAIAYLQIGINRWGKPAHLSKKEGGIAIWNKKQLKNTCFELIELRDESVAHCVPLPHRDFLYTFIKYDVSPNRFADVLSLSGSVSYDPLKKLLRARCGSNEANIATLYLSTEIANGNQKIEDIQKNGIYKKTILSTSAPQEVERIYNSLCANIANQSGNINVTGFWPAAFPEGCCPGYDAVSNTCDN